MKSISVKPLNFQIPTPRSALGLRYYCQSLGLEKPVYQQYINHPTSMGLKYCSFLQDGTHILIIGASLLSQASPKKQTWEVISSGYSCMLWKHYLPIVFTNSQMVKFMFSYVFHYQISYWFCYIWVVSSLCWLLLGQRLAL